MRPPKCITFDCYGTLIDWKSGIETALREAIGPSAPTGPDLMAAYLKAEKEEESVYAKYRGVLARAAARTASSLGVSLSDAQAGRFADSVPGWPAFPDSARVLRVLGARGYSRFILSNVDNDILESTISTHKLEVDGAVTAEQTRSYKPSPGHWVEFAARTGAGYGEMLHVAQSVYHDIIPAQLLGIRCVWVNRYGDALPDGARPHYVVGSLEDLLGILP